MFNKYIAIVVAMVNGTRRCYSVEGVDSGSMKSVLAVCSIRFIVAIGKKVYRNL